MRHFKAGSTIRVTAKDLTHSESGAVDTGATGTIKLYDADGLLVDSQTPTNGGSGDDWHVDFTAPDPSPAASAEYTIKADITKTGAIYRDDETIIIESF